MKIINYVQVYMMLKTFFKKVNPKPFKKRLVKKYFLGKSKIKKYFLGKSIVKKTF